MLQSTFSQYEFTASYEDDETLYFSVLQMRDSVFVYGGDGSKRLGHMATAIQTKWDPMPVSTTVLGEFTPAPL